MGRIWSRFGSGILQDLSAISPPVGCVRRGGPWLRYCTLRCAACPLGANLSPDQKGKDLQAVRVSAFELCSVALPALMPLVLQTSRVRPVRELPRHAGTESKDPVEKLSA